MSLSAPAKVAASIVELEITGDEETSDGLADLLQRAADLTWTMAGDGGPASISVALMDDRAITALNAAFRGKDKPTDVLSFPADDDGLPGLDNGFLGDIALALPFIRAEAAIEEKHFEDHLVHLFVHGVLHLIGHDHEEPAEAQEMEEFETRIVACMGIADPYAGRALDIREK